MCKNDILVYIFNNKLLTDAIKNISGSNYDEFRSHFLMIMCEIDEDKLIGLYLRNELDWFCLKIMTNQMRSKTSTWHKEYRNSGLVNSIDVYLEKDFSKFIYDTDEYVEPINAKEIIKEIKSLLSKQYDDFLVNQYHEKLFNLYYFDKMKLQEIEKLTNIHFVSVGRSIRKTKEYLKNNITQYDNNNFKMFVIGKIHNKL